MTECERLIANGTFTRDFFKPEVRCDFLVDEKRKKIWAIELDLLLQFDKVCKKHGLRYYLFGGTLLGAIRHNGYIPWDDDIDIVMPRDDYDTFLTRRKEFNQQYHLQMPGVEEGYGYSFAKLRNTLTTCSCDIFAYAPFNQGLFIDIFPLDNIDKANGRSLYEDVKGLCLDNSTCMRIGNPHLDASNIQRVTSCTRKNIFENQAKIDQIARRFNNKPCEFFGLNTSAIDPYEINVFEKKDFSRQVMHLFEGFKFPIPDGYENILKTNFGNFMELPPLSERGMRHASITFLPDIPYDTYRRNITTHIPC